MLRTFSLQAATAGTLAAFVGFASSFAVLIQGFMVAGASRVEAASGLMAVCVLMGLGAVVVALRTRMPISVAWSTPGAVLLIASGPIEGGFPVAVGAFVVAGVLVVLAGLYRPLGRWVASIPAPLANAMLAGVLLNLCLAPVRAVGEAPVAALVIIAAWALVGRVRRLLAVPAAVVVAAIVIAATTEIDAGTLGSLWPQPALVLPEFRLAAAIGIGVPLFVVTMASQNIPGIAVLNLYGYRPDASALFRLTGFLSLVATPFGGHAINLAAITAAICAGDDAHPDPARRYWSAVVGGIVYVLLGLGAGAAAAFIGAAPPILIEAVAGLALLGPLGAALLGAVSAPTGREAALVTFLVAASGLTVLGIGGAFWGLIAGGAMLALARAGRSAGPH
ncbi:benzoate membrane transport protein [Stella humosa]|uniref:Benzoate membrane transport protein n=1 Tax=Stella humosa TaxID=94 RepID=A0A3N1KYN5_9PROT|nr:benzoate/H(+) symporter BenE family transporter [Stella humosa]ROP83740.1 benzoate membrane transport protein [Stella humosa]BBK32998.1 benzoate transporter [Stella humosa]